MTFSWAMALAQSQTLLFELTCPLERNIHTANTYKRDKYSGMQGDLEDKGWKVHLVPYEVSSRGQILKSTKSSIISTLKDFKIKIKAEQLMFKQLSKIALLSTFSIFHAYQTMEWVSPPLLNPWLILELACSWKWFTMQRLWLAYSFKHLLFIVTFSVEYRCFLFFWKRKVSSWY